MATVAVVGLGLIGGSMAKAISARTEHTVLAVERDERVLTRAIADGAVAGKLEEKRIPQCDLVLIALYPEAAIAYLREAAPLLAPHTLVVDLCGVKRRVFEEMSVLAETYGFHYFGGHPMAGREQSGYEYALATLFDGAAMILIPGDAPLDQVAWAEEFFLRLGFDRITRSTPQEHDRMIAYTSQLAHVLSSAYIQSPNVPGCLGYTAGSFEDLTRVAYLHPEMWTELFLENNDLLADEVEQLARRLLHYAKAIREDDSRALVDMLARGRDRKAEWRTLLEAQKK